MTESGKDILRRVFSKIDNVRPDQIIFTDARQEDKKTKIKDKSITEQTHISVDNQEGLQILVEGIKTTAYKDIKKRRRIGSKTKDSLQEWSALDFFEFAHELYIEKYGEDWDLRRGGGSVEINRIIDKLYVLCSFPSNLIMRDYIIFFFKNYMDFYKREKSGFYFRQMRNDNLLKAFLDGYDFRERFLAYIQNKEGAKEEEKLTSKGVEKSFRLSAATLICNYGLVIALNWLLLVKGMKRKKAVKIILSSFRTIQKRNLQMAVKKATELYSPYPNWFIFKKPHLIFNKMGMNDSLDLTFADNYNNHFNFLRKEVNG